MKYFCPLSGIKHLPKFCIPGPSRSLVALGNDPLEGEGEADDDDDEGIVETDDGGQDDSQQAVTETEKVCKI